MLKKILVVNAILYSIILSTNANAKNFYSEKNVDYLRTFIKAGENSSISSTRKFKHHNNNFELVTFSKNNVMQEHLLVLESKNGPYVVAIFNSDFDVNKFKIEDFNFNYKNLTNKKNSDWNFYDGYYHIPGVDFSENTTQSSAYFPLYDPSTFLYSYSSSYLQETKIQNVPSYKNTMWVDEDGYASGCTPTATSMYFAYLEDVGYNALAGNRDLPLTYNENPGLINNFISYLGNNFFNTTTNGTGWLNIPNGYKSYLNNAGYYDYKVHVSKKYYEYIMSISTCALPVHISLTLSNGGFHDVLGVGYRTIFNSLSTQSFIYCNYGQLSSPDEAYVSTDVITQFYFIHR